MIPEGSEGGTELDSLALKSGDVQDEVKKQNNLYASKSPLVEALKGKSRLPPTTAELSDYGYPTASQGGMNLQHQVSFGPQNHGLLNKAQLFE